MKWIKNFLPERLLKKLRPFYHGSLARFANVYYGEPSKELTVIGITGTAGKSTTAIMLSWILNHAGKKCGLVTTVNFFDGKEDRINKHGLSMPSGTLLHRYLKTMLDNGCKYAVVECTSEGLAQNRHLGIDFDVAALTNISPAHIEAHGSFVKYRAAKAVLFKSIGQSQTGITQKTFVVNLDDQEAEYFLQFPAQLKIGISFLGKTSPVCSKVLQATKTEKGFNLEGQDFQIVLPGEFNKYNALLATTIACSLGVELKDCAAALLELKFIRGRMEPVPNNRGIKIFVDYGCEPATIRAALMAAVGIPHNKLIHVFGTTGGHRDTSKRFDFGKASAELADVSILTNDDVYESDPQEIIDNMQSGFDSVPENNRKSKQVLQIPDRRAAIAQALSIAKKDDIVLITGKGSEQFLVLPGNKRIEWDEVSEVKNLL